MRYKKALTLISAALAISLILISTQIYVYRLSNTRIKADYDTLTDYVIHLEQGSRHVVVASLINVSEGGKASTLASNLERWESFVGQDYRYGLCDLSATPLVENQYFNGVWLDFGFTGRGVSSACSDFVQNISGRGVKFDDSYSYNVSTVLMVSVGWEIIDASETQVTVRVDLLNDGECALAGDIIVSYLNGNWRDPAILPDYTRLDYGNGTYGYSFSDDIPDDERMVRVQAHDRRDVFVQTAEGSPRFLAGAQQTLSMFDNDTWTIITPPGLFRDAHAMDSNGDYWLIGDNDNYVWKYDGLSFVDISPAINPFLKKIVAIGWGDGYWLVGDDDGKIQKYNGTSWADLTYDAGFFAAGSTIEAVLWNQDFGYWLVGGDSIVKKYEGNTWTDISPSSRVFEDKIDAIGCNSSFWLVGDRVGVFQKYDGSSWTDLTLDAGFYSDGKSIYAVEWGEAYNMFLVGGKDGYIKTFDGAVFSDESGGWDSTDDINAMDWSDSYSYWLVGGEHQKIKRFDGTTWMDETSAAGLDRRIRAISIELYG